MELEISFEDPWFETTDLADLAQASVVAAQCVAPELANPRLVTSLLFTGDRAIHVLNREWRQRDKPTNVLSFPMLARSELLALERDGPPIMLGDIALAKETVWVEAQGKSVTVEDHIAHLVIHGLLHLAGYDHVQSDKEAEAMEALETHALAKMDIADPYGGRDFKE
ncbi:MAG: rRNA maturation RNase YbeY [Pseudomonadota bacterium]